jgi:hypothetical protein
MQLKWAEWFGHRASHRDRGLLLLVPLHHFCVWQLPSKDVECAAHSDVHSAPASCCNSFQVSLQTAHDSQHDVSLCMSIVSCSC